MDINNMSIEVNEALTAILRAIEKHENPKVTSKEADTEAEGLLLELLQTYTISQIEALSDIMDIITSKIPKDPNKAVNQCEYMHQNKMLVNVALKVLNEYRDDFNYKNKFISLIITQLKNQCIRYRLKIHTDGLYRVFYQDDNGNGGIDIVEDVESYVEKNMALPDTSFNFIRAEKIRGDE